MHSLRILSSLLCLIAVEAKASAALCEASLGARLSPNPFFLSENPAPSKMQIEKGVRELVAQAFGALSETSELDAFAEYVLTKGLLGLEQLSLGSVGLHYADVFKRFRGFPDASEYELMIQKEFLAEWKRLSGEESKREELIHTEASLGGDLIIEDGQLRGRKIPWMNYYGEKQWAFQDLASQKIWLEMSNALRWDFASRYCEGLNEFEINPFAGIRWHLPSKDEFLKAFNPSNSLKVNSAFRNVGGLLAGDLGERRYWSSTPHNEFYSWYFSVGRSGLTRTDYAWSQSNTNGSFHEMSVFCVGE